MKQNPLSNAPVLMNRQGLALQLVLWWSYFGLEKYFSSQLAMPIHLMPYFKRLNSDVKN